MSSVWQMTAVKLVGIPPTPYSLTLCRARVEPDADWDVAGHLQQAREAKRQIGVVSATFLIVNRVIGTGIFATPGSIFALSGSVGLSLFIWV